MRKLYVLYDAHCELCRRCRAWLSNEPAFVRHTAEFLANLRGETLEELAEACVANTVSFFRLDG